MNWLYVFIGGGIGSVLRYSLSVLTIRSINVKWAPLLGTFGSNILACIFLAMLLKWESNGSLTRPAFLLLATGLCGGFSTFSTFSMETYHFWMKGEYLWSVINVIVSVAIGLLVMGVLVRSWPNA